MKKTKIPILLAAVLAYPSSALGDFKGGDSFARLIPSNWIFSSIGGGDYFAQNSRLEFIVNSPLANNEAHLIWIANSGGYDQSWFMQVDVAVGTLALPDEADVQDLSLGVFPSDDRGIRYLDVGMRHIRTQGFVDRGIAVFDTRSYYQERRTNASAATLRLHYDRSARTITPSWNTGKGWEYGGPRDLVAWNMKPSETFRAILFARNRALNPENAKVVSGQAWFKDFITGNASPDIVVERSPSSELKDNKGTVSFGTVKTNSGKVRKVFKIRNHGTAELKGLKLSVLGANAKDFRISRLGKDKLAPGAFTTFNVLFRPRDSGKHKATVYLTSNDKDESSFEIRVSGRSVD